MPTVSKPRKKGNRWEINFIDAAGKRRFKTFRTKTEANAAIHHYHSDAQKIRAGVVEGPLGRQCAARITKTTCPT